MTKGELIKARRKELGLTQDDLAFSTGVTKATVSRWESGDIQKMKLPQVEALARTIQIDPIILVRDEALFNDELDVVRAYRNAEDWQKSAVLKILNINEGGDQ